MNYNASLKIKFIEDLKNEKPEAIRLLLYHIQSDDYAALINIVNSYFNETADLSIIIEEIISNKEILIVFSMLFWSLKLTSEAFACNDHNFVISTVLNYLKANMKDMDDTMDEHSFLVNDYMLKILKSNGIKLPESDELLCSIDTFNALVVQRQIPYQKILTYSVTNFGNYYYLKDSTKLLTASKICEIVTQYFS